MKWFRKRSHEPLDKVTPALDDHYDDQLQRSESALTFSGSILMKDLEKVHETQWNEVKKDLSELLQKRMEQVYVGTPEEVIPKILENENYLAEAKIESSKDIENIGNYLTKYSKMDVPKTEAQRLTDELIKADVKDMEDLTNKYMKEAWKAFLKLVGVSVLLMLGCMVLFLMVWLLWGVLALGE